MIYDSCGEPKMKGKLHTRSYLKTGIYSKSNIIANGINQKDALKYGNIRTEENGTAKYSFVESSANLCSD